MQVTINERSDGRFGGAIMFKQFPRCQYKPKLLNVTLDNSPPDPFQKQIFDLEELEVSVCEGARWRW